MVKYSHDLNDSNTHLSNAVIATYITLKNNLSEKEISFIENHIAQCAECKKRLSEMIKEDIEIDEGQINSGIKERNSYYIWAAAAMIIIALGIGTYYFFLPEEKIIVQDKNLLIDSLKIKENKQDFKESNKQGITENKVKEYNDADFAVNNVLENFVNRNVRSASSIKIISPEIGDTSVIPITFRWEGSDEGTTSFELVNNRNKSITKKTLTENNFTYSSKLNPGLYYWKIFPEGKLEAVGNFYIK